MRHILTIAFASLLAVWILPATADEPKKIALLVGVNQYFDKDWESLNHCENDVIEVAKQLKMMGFEPTILTGKAATCEKVQLALTEFMEKAHKLEKSDIVLVMFSGHGTELGASVKTESGSTLSEVPYFCPYDAKALSADSRQGLRAKPEDEIAAKLRLISLNQVVKLFEEKSNSLNNLLMVDACRNNPGKGKSAGIAGGSARQLPRGTSILFSAKVGQKSWESSDSGKPHGVLSYFLLKGLRGEGEAHNARGDITWLRLATYLSEEVPQSGPKLAGAADRVQNPNFVNNSDTNIVLGKATALAANKMSAVVADAKNTSASSANPGAASTTFTNSIGMKFNRIKAGRFLMGAVFNGRLESLNPRDDVPHDVELTRPFYIAVHEVTQKQWNTIMPDKANPWVGAQFATTGDDVAASCVSWEDAQAFIVKLNALEKENGKRYRLPTEAEWEYACRAGARTKYSFGNSESDLSLHAWWGGMDDGNATKQKHARKVGLKKPNPFGLFDMHGNVSEWCEDVYGLGFYHRPGANKDPLNDNRNQKDKETTRVTRGGSWRSKADECYSTTRSDALPGRRLPAIGFRVAADAR